MGIIQWGKFTLVHSATPVHQGRIDWPTLPGDSGGSLLGIPHSLMPILWTIVSQFLLLLDGEFRVLRREKTGVGVHICPVWAWLFSQSLYCPAFASESAHSACMDVSSVPVCSTTPSLRYMRTTVTLFLRDIRVSPGVTRETPVQ